MRAGHPREDRLIRPALCLWCADVWGCEGIGIDSGSRSIGYVQGGLWGREGVYGGVCIR